MTWVTRRRNSGLSAITGLAVLFVTELIAGEHYGVARPLAAQRIHSNAPGALDAPALSHDGRFVAFVARTSTAGRYCCRNVYVVDTVTGIITQESRRSDGTSPDADSLAPSLSGDGRVLAFETVASGLLPDARRTSARRVVVRDRTTGRMRTPTSARGEEPDGDTGDLTISGNGLVVVFTSDATNVASGTDANGRQLDVYLWRLDTGEIARISTDSNGVQPSTGASHSPSVSREGELVAFVSSARLVPEDVNEMPDVFLRDVRRGRTVLVSRGLHGKPADGASYAPTLSADGRYVAFASLAANLGAADRNHESDAYIYDIASGVTTLVSATSTGEAANAGSRRPALSADGRLVVFESVASNLGSPPGCPHTASDTNLLPDVYLLDRATRCVSRISGSRRTEWWSPSVAPAISGRGSLIVFSSTQPVDEHDVTTGFNLFQSSAAPP
jgi:Tol biopolymer transport system component